jgi:hypothetical protein
MSYKIDVPDNILVDAEKLRCGSLQKKQIIEQLKEILKNISSEIKIAYTQGKHEIITGIPTVFEIASMTNAEAQRVIWANILLELKKKNYRVKIKHDNASCYLKITWLSENDETEMRAQLQTLIEHNDSSL